EAPAAAGAGDAPGELSGAGVAGVGAGRAESAAGGWAALAAAGAGVAGVAAGGADFIASGPDPFGPGPETFFSALQICSILNACSLNADSTATSARRTSNVSNAASSGV